MVLHKLLKPFLLACGKVLWHICKVCIAVSWRNAPLDSSLNPSSQVDLRKQGKCQYQFYSYCSWETICCSPFAKRGKREWSHCNEFGHSLISLWLTHKLQFRLWLIVQDKEGSSRGNNTVSPSLWDSLWKGTGISRTLAHSWTEILGVQLASTIFLISEEQWPVCPVRCYRARGSQEETSVKPGWSASCIIMLARAALQPLLHPRAVPWKQH